MRTVLPTLLALPALFSALVLGTTERPAADLPILAIAVERGPVPQIVLFEVNGRMVRELTHPNGANSPSWSPDGKRIALVSTAPGQIYAMNSDGTGSVQLTDTSTGEIYPDWSPDGKKIAFDSMRNGNHDIFVMESDGSNPRSLTDDPRWDADPAWSPDGKQVLFASNRTGRFRVWVMNADGSDQREVVKKDLFGWVYPSWSPDGRQILFCDFPGDGSGQLYVGNVDGQAVERLTDGDGVNTFGVWSPDGRYIAYLQFDRRPDMSPQSARLMILDVEAGTRKAVSPEGMKCTGRPAWKPMTR